MIVLLVLSVLVVLAYPSYQTQMIENRRTDGQRVLLEIMNEQQKFHSINGFYTLNLNAGANGLGMPEVDSGEVASENGFYHVSAAVCDASTTIAECVLLTALPQPGQASDGPLTYNSRNVKTPATHW